MKTDNLENTWTMTEEQDSSGQMLRISPTYKQNQHVTETKSQMYSKSPKTTESVPVQHVGSFLTWQ